MNINFNRVVLAGHLVKDVEYKYLDKGTGFAVFRLGMNRKWFDEEGQEREERAFVDVEAFGLQGECLAKHLKRGSSVMVEGRLRTDDWVDKESGERRSKLKVILEKFRFMGYNGYKKPWRRTVINPLASV